MNLGFPDVCNTPGPVGPIPVPYPNISQGNMCNPGT
ncbi:PAAR-like domain-containing protein, partial [uncultured Shewanella sp.]